MFVDLSADHARLGGSALTQVFKPLGDTTPDYNIMILKRAFRETQQLLREYMLLESHNRSDGSLLSTVLEICLCDDCGCEMDAVRACEERIHSARSELNSVAFDVSAFERLEVRVRDVEQ